MGGTGFPSTPFVLSLSKERTALWAKGWLRLRPNQSGCILELAYIMMRAHGSFRFSAVGLGMGRATIFRHKQSRLALIRTAWLIGRVGRCDPPRYFVV
jgi:hypothetical protein